MANETKTAEASAASRAMMKALADRLMFTAPTAAELVAQAIRRGLDALIAGDLVAYTREGFALADAVAQVTRAWGEAEDTIRAMATLDPAYFAAVNAIALPLAIRGIRSGFVGKSDFEIAKAYVTHAVACSSPPSGCVKHAAILEELKSRRMEVPNL